jgi:hypothetical protein
MKLQIALLGLLAVGASAFSPKPLVTVPSKSIITSSTEHAGLWRPPMNTVAKMVAGGAEKAYGEEYYDGTSLSLCSLH